MLVLIMDSTTEQTLYRYDNYMCTPVVVTDLGKLISLGGKMSFSSILRLAVVYLANSVIELIFVGITL